MNFLLTEMTFLRYFVPLIVRGNSMGIRSRVFVGSSSKYNCPRRDSNIRDLVSLSHLHCFALHEIEEVVIVKVDNDKDIYNLINMTDFGKEVASYPFSFNGKTTEYAESSKNSIYISIHANVRV